MKFEKAFHAQKHRYSLGREADSGLYFLAIPMSNQLVDYMEYYKINENEYRTFRGDPSLATAFADSCRRRERDDRLFMQPGNDRGVPR